MQLEGGGKGGQQGGGQQQGGGGAAGGGDSLVARTRFVCCIQLCMPDMHASTYFAGAQAVLDRHAHEVQTILSRNLLDFAEYTFSCDSIKHGHMGVR